MRVELLVSEWCAPCHQAEKVWRALAEERDFEFSVIDLAQPEGRELASRLRIKTIPALVVDGALAGIGVQTAEEARRLVQAAPAKRPGDRRYAGLGLSPSARVAVHSSMAYLFAAGGYLAVHGSLLDGAAWPAGLHLFTLGFITFLLYGLGEHMLPRFTGNPIRSGPLVGWQLAAAHAGVLAFAGGVWVGARALELAGMASAWIALLIFAIRLWPVLWGAPPGTSRIVPGARGGRPRMNRPAVAGGGAGRARAW